MRHTRWKSKRTEVATAGFPGPPGESGTGRTNTKRHRRVDTMKTAITRFITASAIVLVFLASACIGPSPTDPGGSNPAPTVLGDPPDEVVKN